MDTTHLLMRFGLTHQEARLYIALLGGGELTGYELAKELGVSRSNAYAGLSSLVDKGGAYLVDGKPARYIAVPPGEFCGNTIRHLQQTFQVLEKQLAAPPEAGSAYVTIRGGRHIRDKIHGLISGTQYRIYISMPRGVLEEFLPALSGLAERGLKVVVITDAPLAFAGATVYLSAALEHIRIISDTAKALTGSLSDEASCTCLYSRKENLVSLLRDSMRNEIRLIELSGGN